MDTSEKIAGMIKDKIVPGMSEDKIIELMSQALKDTGSFNRKEISYLISYDQDFVSDVFTSLK
jgi:hypothetical protein